MPMNNLKTLIIFRRKCNACNCPLDQHDVKSDLGYGFAEVVDSINHSKAEQHEQNNSEQNYPEKVYPRCQACNELILTNGNF